MHGPQREKPGAERSSRAPASAARDGLPRSSGGRAIPIVALILAVAYPAVAVGAPSLMAFVVIAAALAGAALARAYREPRAFTRTLALTGAWLSGGFAGALLLRGESLGGLAWVLVAIYLLPLPVIPWLFARSFPTEPRAADPVERPSADARMPPSAPGAQPPGPASEGTP